MPRRFTRPLRPRPVSDELDTYLDLSVTGRYYRRNKQLSALLDAHRSGENPLFVCGFPKSGKTIFAQELAWNLTRQPEDHFLHYAPKTFILPFAGSIRKTISSFHIPCYITMPDFRHADESGLDAQRYRDKLCLLRRFTPEGSVFIVDQADGISIGQLTADPDYPDLLSLGTVIFVTDDTQSLPQWIIDPIPDRFRTSASPSAREFTEDERIILQNAALLPCTGMRSYRFIHGQNLKRRSVVLQLIREGWLTETSDQRILPAHILPAGPDSDYDPFLSFLHRTAVKPTSYRPQVYDQICHCFKIAANTLEDREGRLARCAAELFKARGDHAEVYPLYNLYLQKQLALEPQNPVTLAEALYAVGCIRAFRSFGSANVDWDTAKDYLRKALSIQLWCPECSAFARANTRLALAQLLWEDGNPEEADALCEQALSAFSEITAASPEQSQVILEAAAVYQSRFARNRLSREYAEKALELLENQNFPDEALADVCSMISECLPASDLDQRITWLKKAIAAREKFHPRAMGTLCTEYRHLAYLAELQGKPQLAQEALTKLTELLAQMVPPEHSLLAKSSQKLREILRNTCTDTD